MKVLLATCILLGALPVAASPRPFVLIDRDGKTVATLDAKYTYAEPPREGRILAGVTNAGAGFVDLAGREVVPPRYYEAGSFSDGLAPVRLTKDAKLQFIDRSGRTVISTSYEWPTAGVNFREGLAVVRQGSLCGYIDKTGKLVIPITFEGCHSFHEGLAEVGVKGKKAGYIDRTGKVVIAPRYEETTPFTDGLASVRVAKAEWDIGRWIVIDRTGKTRHSNLFDRAAILGDRMIVTKRYRVQYPKDDHGEPVSEQFVTAVHKGKTVGQGRWFYGGPEPASEGIVTVLHEGWYGPDGAFVKHTPAGSFHDGRVRVAGGYADVTGKLVIQGNYERASDFSEGFAIVRPK